MEKLSERIKKETNYTREIKIKFPIEVYDEFSLYAKEHTGDCFWLAIKNLLEDKKLSDKYDLLEQRIRNLESQNAIPKETRQEFKGFGRGN